jgi:hypothetical protein
MYLNVEFRRLLEMSARNGAAEMVRIGEGHGALRLAAAAWRRLASSPRGAFLLRSWHCRSKAEIAQHASEAKKRAVALRVGLVFSMAVERICDLLGICAKAADRRLCVF